MGATKSSQRCLIYGSKYVIPAIESSAKSSEVVFGVATQKFLGKMTIFGFPRTCLIFSFVSAFVEAV